MKDHQKNLKKFVDNTPNPAHYQIIFETENLDEELKPENNQEPKTEKLEE